MNNTPESTSIVIEFSMDDLWRFTKNLGEIVEPKTRFTGDMVQMQAAVIRESQELAINCLIMLRNKLPHHELGYVDRVLEQFK